MKKVKVNFNSPLCYYDLAYFMKDYINENTVIICIGTDRCIGDCLGPLVGTYLLDHNFPLPVYGTIAEPIHALNLDKRLDTIKHNHCSATTIAIDACIGEECSIGEIQARDFPVHPGKGVGKYLTQVGDASIIGIVDCTSPDEFFINRNIRLDLIISMAKIITQALLHAYYIKCRL